MTQMNTLRAVSMTEPNISSLSPSQTTDLASRGETFVGRPAKEAMFVHESPFIADGERQLSEWRFSLNVL
jgi:hypothetical protein